MKFWIKRESDGWQAPTQGDYAERDGDPNKATEDRCRLFHAPPQAMNCSAVLRWLPVGAAAAGIGVAALAAPAGVAFADSGTSASGTTHISRPEAGLSARSAATPASEGRASGSRNRRANAAAAISHAPVGVSVTQSSFVRLDAAPAASVPTSAKATLPALAPSSAPVAAQGGRMAVSTSARPGLSSAVAGHVMYAVATALDKASSRLATLPAGPVTNLLQTELSLVQQILLPPLNPNRNLVFPLFASNVSRKNPSPAKLNLDGAYGGTFNRTPGDALWTVRPGLQGPSFTMRPNQDVVPPEFGYVQSAWGMLMIRQNFNEQPFAGGEGTAHHWAPFEAFLPQAMLVSGVDSKGAASVLVVPFKSGYGHTPEWDRAVKLTVGQSMTFDAMVRYWTIGLAGTWYKWPVTVTVRRNIETGAEVATWLNVKVDWNFDEVPPPA